jgi:hypothetical protein
MAEAGAHFENPAGRQHLLLEASTRGLVMTSLIDMIEGMP